MTDEPFKSQDNAAPTDDSETQVPALPEENLVLEDVVPYPQAATLPEETPTLEDTISDPQPDDVPGQPASPQDFAAPPPPSQTYNVSAAVTPLSVADERTWAMLAHLSVLANLLGLVIPFGPVIALVIYLVYRQRSHYVAYQSLQAFVFQLVWWVGGGLLTGVAWAVTGILSAVLVGFCLMPFACLITLMPLVALIYGVFAAVEASQGRDFRYWLIGDWVRSIWSGV